MYLEYNMRKCSLYVTRLTTIDCGMLLGDVNPKMVGFSVNVSVELTGNLDPEENVIVDFGTLKKDLKRAIDSLDENGYDHKLLVPKYPKINGTSDVTTPIHIAHRDGKSLFIHTKDNLALLKVPTDAIRVVDTGLFSNLLLNLDPNVFLDQTSKLSFSEPEVFYLFYHAFQTELMGFLNDVVRKLYPDLDVAVTNVKCDTDISEPVNTNCGTEIYNLDEDNVVEFIKSLDLENEVFGYDLDRATSYFSYTHGLKNSTSLGCQNIGHGHLSYIQLVMDSSNWTSALSDQAWDIVDKISKELNGTHFIFNENLKMSDIDTDIRIKYESKDRGEFLMSNKDESCSIVPKYKVLLTETTVENLAQFVADQFKDLLSTLEGLKAIYVSEGLHKGSFVLF